MEYVLVFLFSRHAKGLTAFFLPTAGNDNQNVLLDLITSSMALAGLEVETLNYSLNRSVSFITPFRKHIILMLVNVVFALFQMGCSMVVTHSSPHERNRSGTSDDRVLALQWRQWFSRCYGTGPRWRHLRFIRWSEG